MKVIYSLIAVLLLAAVGYFGAAAGLDFLFGVIIPYLSVLLFFCGLHLANFRLDEIPGSFPHSYNLRAGKVPEMDKKRRIGKSLRVLGSGRQDVTGSFIFSFFVPQ